MESAYWSSDEYLEAFTREVVFPTTRVISWFWMHRDPEIQEACSFPLALILWSYVVIYCSQCVHFFNFLSAVREGTNRKAINLSVKFSVLESFSEQCSRLLLKYSFQISHKLWLFIFLEIRKPSSSKREVIGVTYLQYQKGFLFWTMP